MNWRECTIGDLATLVTKGTTPTTYGMPFTDEGVNFIKAEALNGDASLDRGGFAFISSDTHEKLARSQLAELDVLVTIAGANVGKCGLVRACDLPANTNQAVGIIRVDHDVVDPRFLYYHFKLPSTRHLCLSIGGQAAQPNVNLTNLKAFPIRLPDKDEQTRIVEILSVYDDLIENNHRRIALLEQAARELYREWFIRLRFPGHDGIKFADGLPEGWRRQSLEEVCARITDGSHWSPQSVDEGRPMASVKDMRDWDFDLSNARLISEDDFQKLVAADCRPLPGDILVAKDGANLNKHTFHVTEHRDLVVLSSIAIIRPSYQVCPEYLTAVLKDDAVSQAIKNMVSGAAIPRIILRDFRSLEVVIPTDAVQQLWRNTYGPIAEQCRKLFQANFRLSQARDLLLPRLMNGSIAT